MFNQLDRGLSSLENFFTWGFQFENTRRAVARLHSDGNQGLATCKPAVWLELKGIFFLPICKRISQQACFVVFHKRLYSTNDNLSWVYNCYELPLWEYRLLGTTCTGFHFSSFCRPRFLRAAVSCVFCGDWECPSFSLLRSSAIVDKLCLL